MVRLPVLGSASFVELAPSKIIAVGLNYREHVAESGTVLAPGGSLEPPAAPLLFAKTPNVLIGPGEPVVIPLSWLRSQGIAAPRTDHEAELAVVIGRRCRRVGRAEALDCVLGYSCFNDVSQRDTQNGDRSGWFRGKSFDGFGPIGPVLAPAERLADAGNLAIECRVNGRVVQRSRTSAMIFSVAELVSYISMNLTLEPGDIIATGTPSGVGPLAAGDLVEVEIEGIGILRNPVEED